MFAEEEGIRSFQNLLGEWVDYRSEMSWKGPEIFFAYSSSVKWTEDLFIFFLKFCVTLEGYPQPERGPDFRAKGKFMSGGTCYWP